jgi:HAD superfamily hydrolase (TIGR01549 family)
MKHPVTGRPLRALTIDLWNTLIFDVPESGDARVTARLDAIEQILRARGFPVERETLLRAHEAAGERLVQLQSSGADKTAEAHVRDFLDALAHPDIASLRAGDIADLVAAYGEAALTSPPRLFDGVVEALAALHGAGLKLALVSNTSRTPGRVLRRILADAGAYPYFDGFYFSDEVGVAKPNPRIFALALGALHVPASEAMHVGDDLSLDLEGARRAGLGIVFIQPERPAALQAEELWAPRFAEVPAALGIGTSGS